MSFNRRGAYHPLGSNKSQAISNVTKDSRRPTSEVSKGEERDERAGEEEYSFDIVFSLDNQVFGVVQTVEAGETPYLRPRKKASFPLYEHSVKKLDYRVSKSHSSSSAETSFETSEIELDNARQQSMKSSVPIPVPHLGKKKSEVESFSSSSEASPHSPEVFVGNPRDAVCNTVKAALRLKFGHFRDHRKHQQKEEQKKNKPKNMTGPEKGTKNEFDKRRLEGARLFQSGSCPTTSSREEFEKNRPKLGLSKSIST